MFSFVVISCFDKFLSNTQLKCTELTALSSSAREEVTNVTGRVVSSERVNSMTDLSRNDHYSLQTEITETVQRKQYNERNTRDVDKSCRESFFLPKTEYSLSQIQYWNVVSERDGKDARERAGIS